MTEIPTNSSSKIIIISHSEIFHLFSTINVSVWVTFLLVIAYGIYQNISTKCRLKALLLGGGDHQISHMFAITILASEPSLAYDYDNTSIRIDLSDKNDELIVSLLMRPLWAFHSIQPKPNSSSMWKTPKESDKDILDKSESVNLSRQVPLIGIYKFVSDKNLNKVEKILMGHDCPHPDASILVRCVEITNLSSLISHTYPLNAYIPYLSKPISFSFDSSKEVFEFDSSEDLPPRTQYQLNSTLNSMERGSFWLFSFNIISFNSYFWCQSYEYISNKEFLMWYKALLLSLIIGSLVAVLHISITLSYRLFKEYNLFYKTNKIIFLKRLFLWTVLLISLILFLSNIAIANHSIRSTMFLRWYRIAFLSSLIFLSLSVVFTFCGVFVHIRPKLRNENSFDTKTLEIPKEGEKLINYEMIVQNSCSLQINNMKNVTIFSSAWLRSALNQHQGLDRSILCDVYEVTVLPKGGVTTNLSENAIKLFGEEMAKDNRGAAYATRLIEQKGMVVSVSQYGRKKKDQKTVKKDKEVLNIENNNT